MVLDNLREGVLTPDIYDPTLNPLYRELQHYGVVALPCRVQDLDRTVGCKQRAEAFVAAHDDFQQILGSSMWEFGHAEVVDDE